MRYTDNDWKGRTGGSQPVQTGSVLDPWSKYFVRDMKTIERLRAIVNDANGTYGVSKRGTDTRDTVTAARNIT